MTGRFDRPHQGFMASGTTLATGHPAAIGLDPADIEEMVAGIASYAEPTTHARPHYAGAVVLAAHAGRIVAHEATGWAVRYADADGTELPEPERILVGPDTIFDLASVSKLFTTIVVLQQVERALLDLDRPVAEYLPAFAAHGKDAVTVRQLLTHTTGLPAGLPLWRDWPTRAERLEAALRCPPVAAPETTYLYSDLNLIAAGLVAEAAAGAPLDHLVTTGITEPLGMTDTGFNPSPTLRPRVAATEFQTEPSRGLVHGEVHDENAWSLGGVAGHAGVFGTARDLAVLAQTILNGGSYGGTRILAQSTVTAMLTDENTGLDGASHGLGFELDQRWYMGALAAPSTAGHTGFTGTSLVIDLASRSFVIVLGNRVHPSRTWAAKNPARRAAAFHFAHALAIQPPSGVAAWSGDEAGPGVPAVLEVPVPSGDPRADEVRFELFVDTEAGDELTVEFTGADATWRPLPFVAAALPGHDEAQWNAPDGTASGYHGRHWWQAHAALPAGVTAVRWHYAVTEPHGSRGVAVAAVTFR